MHEHDARSLAGIPAALYEAEPGTERSLRDVSAGIETLLGYPRRAWLDDPGFWIRHVHPDDRERVVKPDAGAGNSCVDYRMIRSDGSVIWVRDQWQSVEGDDPDRRVGVLTAITPKQTSMAATRIELERSRRNIAALLERISRLDGRSSPSPGRSA